MDLLSDKERIRELEIKVDVLLKTCDSLKSKQRTLSAQLEILHRQLKYLLWFFKSWKHFGVLIVLMSLSYSLVDVFVDTAKVQDWFFKQLIPWAIARKMD